MTSGYMDLNVSPVLNLTVGVITWEDLNHAGTGVTFNCANVIPLNAVVSNIFNDITEEFVGNGDSASKIKWGLEDSDEILSDTLISNLSLGIDYGSTTLEKLTGNKSINVTWTKHGTDTALTSGSVTIYVYWTPT